ncbi:MAG: hypothetical protein O7I42_15130 [Alphaproteobacteria bacterium]|nr:hypothetical protein [Alphaproteobacteria bacterium]
MLAIVGAVLAGVPIVMIPLMKVALKRANAPRWMVGGLLPQMVVVVFMCCFIIGVTIAVERILIVTAEDFSTVNLALEAGILGAAIVAGAILTGISRRTA